MESAEEIPLSPFKIEKNIIKKFKTKKLKNGTLLIEICNKNQVDDMLKWKHFDNTEIKKKNYPHNSLNTRKGVVRSH